MRHDELDWDYLIKLGTQVVENHTPYVFGAEVDLDNPDPCHFKFTGIDCSELMEWLYARLRRKDDLTPIHIPLPDGSYNQAKVCERLPSSTSLLVGDLAFKWNPDTEVIHHVGMYVGDGMILEAKGKLWGVVMSAVGSFTASQHFAYWARHKDIIGMPLEVI